MSDESSAVSVRFSDLGLSAPVLQALIDVGYETPSPIQAATIPMLLEGRDVLGQAQTGTGKTAAFALPALSRIEVGQKKPQVLVLAPTRELAIQVAEAFQKYATHIPGFQVLPIYGGQSYGPQLAGLRRGVQVIVGTPGRVIDHIEKGTLKLDSLRYLVLDEADEMLRMGFIDDVEKILQQTPETRQVALFSATMPSQIRRIAQTYLKSPAEITIKAKTTTATNIRQRYWMVSGMQKLDALTRILEVESFEGMLIFARTKNETADLADKLSARGFSAVALNGDIAQRDRERIVQKLKDGSIDIVVATDVAARGLDVERISHVVNYDIPTDTESYVHRIGRTGRAGRSGDAILFVAPRERHLLQAIERATRQTIQRMDLPSTDAVNDQRIGRFKQRIVDALGGDGLDVFRELIESVEREQNVPAVEIAAALARLVQGNTPLLVAAQASTPAAAPRREPAARDFRENRRPERRDYVAPERPMRTERFERPEHSVRAEQVEAPPARAERFEKPVRAERPERPERTEQAERPERQRREKNNDEPSETYRIEVGHAHGVQPGNIVGAIANEAGLESEYIGRIDIREDHSFIDLPQGMPKDVFRDLQKTWVCGQQLRISRAGDSPELPYVTPAKRPTPKMPAKTLGLGKPQGAGARPSPGGPRISHGKSEHRGAGKPGGPRKAPRY
ncbi:ATP-dependent RNA helicase [Solimonas sp. K1W22B-7]|uniref:DEAD/DEAH box helicase n=1 Tax=Solimonas sp. K1W22B-7 TaxID=2303331 RepID=UPI000E331312|nr:DEAD/DEAH box helicase [Solimonas sp. K1W22B-7]AXQ29968.1 ATP-dependent RNA helicase [Solimonas sp. K1W22B-7]